MQKLAPMLQIKPNAMQLQQCLDPGVNIAQRPQRFAGVQGSPASVRQKHPYCKANFRDGALRALARERLV
jgi:hypothetical protein